MTLEYHTHTMSLRKEMFIAITLGLILGGGAAYALVALPQTSQPSPSTAQNTPTSSEPDTPSPSVFAENSLNLEILLPENQALSEEKDVTISGKTLPGTLVTITSSVDQNVTTADENGAFSQRISLDEGTNEIIILALKDQTTQEKRLIVNYTSEDL